MLPRARRALLVLLAIGVVCSGGRAAAEGEGKRFSVHPSIKVTTVAEDNIRLESDDRDSDIGANARSDGLVDEETVLRNDEIKVV